MEEEKTQFITIACHHRSNCDSKTKNIFPTDCGKESNTIKQKQTCLKLEKYDALDLLIEKGNIAVSQLPSSVFKVNKLTSFLP